jgi:hypothetical protein
MGKVRWRVAPDGAEYYADGCFRKGQYYWNKNDNDWVFAGREQSDFHHYSDYEENPETQVAQQWPTEERIDIISTNGGDGLHYDDIREQQETKPALPYANKYDRTIVGKYNSGKCVVDVYRVLNAFPTGSPEIDHAVKKLLAAGKRGAKDELQDLREAVQSIEARINYLSDTGA